jgi:ribosome biogenesis GTPase A
MAKTSQQLQKTLKKIDLVIEVRDARVSCYSFFLLLSQQVVRI